jgi:hypothetical protein
MRTPKQTLMVLELLTVWIMVYLSAIPTLGKDINNQLLNIESTLRLIYSYLLTFSSGRLSISFIMVHHLLVLYRSDQQSFSLEFRSCTFIPQFYVTDISITLYIWLFLVPSSHQVIDWEESKRILNSRKEVGGKLDSAVVNRIVLLQSPCIGTTPSAEAKQLCCFILDKSILGVVALKDSRSWVIGASCWDNTLCLIQSIGSREWNNYLGFVQW